MVKEIGWVASKEAVAKWISGEWEVTAGGFRNIATGKMEELVKPVVKELSKGKLLNSLASPVTLVSSLANNVQSAHIEYGVHQANEKLDISLEKLDNLQRSVSGLSKLGVFGWVNCALGIANCGISIVGFKETFDRLNKISGQLQDMTQMMEKNIEKDYRRHYRSYYMRVKDYIPILISGNIQEQTIAAITPYIGETISFLEDVIESFLDDSINPNLACEMLFSLLTVWSKFIKIYSAIYYYYTNSVLPSYEDWKGIIDRITMPEFLEKVKENLLIQNMDIPLQKKHIVYNTLEYLPNYQLGELLHNERSMQNLSKEEYLNTDAYIKKCLNRGIYDTIDTNIYIPIEQRSIPV